MTPSFEQIGKCRREQTIRKNIENCLVNWRFSLGCCRGTLKVRRNAILVDTRKLGFPMTARRQKATLLYSLTSIKVLIRRATWKIDKSQNKINPHLHSRRGCSILDHERSRSTCVPWNDCQLSVKRFSHPRVVRKDIFLSLFGVYCSIMQISHLGTRWSRRDLSEC